MHSLPNEKSVFLHGGTLRVAVGHPRLNAEWHCSLSAPPFSLPAALRGSFDVQFTMETLTTSETFNALLLLKR